jgi:hypothetical protein
MRDSLFALEAKGQQVWLLYSLEKGLSMRVNGALSLALAVGLVGLGRASACHQLASVTPIQSGEPQPPSPSAESNASFRMEGSTRIHRRKTVRARFYVPKNNSRYHTGFENQKVATAYSGHCWIDLATQRVVRLESPAVDIPPFIPVRVSFHSTDYDLIEISGNKYWLPVRASVRMQLVIDSKHKPADFYKSLYGRSAGTSYRELEVRNVIEYKDYRKFGAEVRLTPQ